MSQKESDNKTGQIIKSQETTEKVTINNSIEELVWKREYIRKYKEMVAKGSPLCTPEENNKKMLDKYFDEKTELTEKETDVLNMEDLRKKACLFAAGLYFCGHNSIKMEDLVIYLKTHESRYGKIIEGTIRKIKLKK